MAQTDNAYSRLVIWLKIVLPLMALAILSSIFLVSRTIDPTATLPYTAGDAVDLAREPRLSGPTFSGVTSSGATVTVSAKEMRPDLSNPQSGSATDLTARIDTPDGGHSTLASESGRIDMQAGTYVMTGDVALNNSAGYRVTAAEMSGKTDASALDASGNVQADAPMGRITSDRMQIRQDNANPDQYLLVFNGGVRLIYQP